jgi:hypothetical protein
MGYIVAGVADPGLSVILSAIASAKVEALSVLSLPNGAKADAGLSEASYNLKSEKPPT